MSDSSIYKNLLTIKITSAKGEEIAVSGCVFDEDKLRIVEINGFAMDIPPQGKIVLFKNTDVPGVIGNIGKIMEQNNINIADFRLGRNDKGEALAMIIVDDDISDSTLGELRKIKAALSVSYVVI